MSDRKLIRQEVDYFKRNFFSIGVVYLIFTAIFIGRFPELPLWLSIFTATVGVVGIFLGMGYWIFEGLFYERNGGTIDDE